MPRSISGAEGARSLVGEELGVSDWHTVSQADIDRFADGVRVVIRQAFEREGFDKPVRVADSVSR